VKHRIAVVLVVAIVAAGCSGSGVQGSAGATATAGAAAAATTAAPAAPVSTASATLAPAAAGAPAAPSAALTATVARLPGEPDPSLTPGAVNPDVTQATIGSTICVSGWTKTVRPPVAYKNRLKEEQIAEYGYANTDPRLYEEDHLIALELGGSPTDPGNLWPEPWSITLPDGRDAGAHAKDQLENSLHRAVCSGSMTLAAAQAEIRGSWVHAYYGIAVGP
jgi:hypothetical protein